MTVHAILVHFNPTRLKVRKRLFEETVKRLKKNGFTVWCVEAAFGTRPHEVTHKLNRYHIQLRTSEEIWNKEALINAGIRRILKKEPKAEYIAWIDADIEFVREDIVNETIAKLQHHKVVQMFSNAIDMSPKYDFMGRAQGFAKLWYEGQRPGDFEDNKQKYPSHMHPGYAWAYRREVLEGIGSMLTVGVLGSGDHHMACGLVGYAKESVWGGLTQEYADEVVAWGDKAVEVAQKDIGYVDGILLHHFHGYKEHRGYKSRVDILKQNQFNPKTDILYDANGLPRFAGNKPQLRDDVRKYMGSRKEYDLTQALEAKPVKKRWFGIW